MVSAMESRLLQMKRYVRTGSELLATVTSSRYEFPCLVEHDR